MSELLEMAKDGRITPDDYAIAESDYVQGSMVYQRLNRILEGENFVADLSAPEVTEEAKKFAREREEAQAQRQAATKKAERKAKVSDLLGGEGGPSILESFNQVNFGQVFTFCCAVIGSAWAYNFVTRTEPTPTRVPAQAAPAVQAVAVEKAEDSIILSQPKKEKRSPGRVQRLMPSERPVARNPNNVGRTRPEIAEVQPASRMDDRRSPDSDRVQRDDRRDNRGSWDNGPENHELLSAGPESGFDDRDPRGTASEGDDGWGNNFLPDDLPRPGEVMPHSESGWENELPPEEWDDGYYEGDEEDY